MTTSQGGAFTFANIFPSTYKILASHPSWTLLNTEQSIQVQFGNTVLPQSFKVVGYDVSGKIMSFGEPSQGVDVFLYSNGGNKLRCSPASADASMPPGKSTGEFGSKDEKTIQCRSFYSFNEAMLTSALVIRLLTYHHFRFLLFAFACFLNFLLLWDVGRTGNPPCFARTDSQGAYHFSNVPCGTYTVVPYYKRSHTTYEVVPAEQTITVKHGA